jgi:hypothetical protein
MGDSIVASIVMIGTEVDEPNDVGKPHCDPGKLCRSNSICAGSDAVFTENAERYRGLEGVTTPDDQGDREREDTQQSSPTERYNIHNNRLTTRKTTYDSSIIGENAAPVRRSAEKKQMPHGRHPLIHKPNCSSAKPLATLWFMSADSRGHCHLRRSRGLRPDRGRSLRSAPDGAGRRHRGWT